MEGYLKMLSVTEHTVCANNTSMYELSIPLVSYPFLLLQEVQLILAVKYLVKLLTTMSSSGGPIRGGRDVLVSVVLPNALTKSTTLPNTEECPILSCG